MFAQVCPVKQSRFGALKKVSGKLRQMWLGRDERSLQETPMPRLLVVDDEESICFSMSEYFSLQGYKVDTASEVEEAEKLLGSTEYKVVIQDLRLTMTSNHDGLDIIKLIRENNPQTRIRETQSGLARARCVKSCSTSSRNRPRKVFREELTLQPHKDRTCELR